MLINRVLKTFLIVFSIVFFSFQILEYEMYAAGIRALLVVMLTLLYFNRVKNKRKYFFLFLITFTIAQLLDFASWYIVIESKYSIDYFYYLGNGLYILSYIFLIILILQTMNAREIFAKFPIHIVILIILDVFCVLIVTGTTEGILSIYEYSLEFIYNAVIMILLSVALLNNIYRDDRKSMNMLVGSIFILFSEVIQLAYFYITEINILNIICSAFLILAFLFFYLQSRLDHQPIVELYNEEGLGI